MKVPNENGSIKDPLRVSVFIFRVAIHTTYGNYFLKTMFLRTVCKKCTGQWFVKMLK